MKSNIEDLRRELAFLLKRASFFNAWFLAINTIASILLVFATYYSDREELFIITCVVILITSIADLFIINKIKALNVKIYNLDQEIFKQVLAQIDEEYSTNKKNKN